MGYLLNKPKDVFVSGSLNESGMTVLDIVGRATKARLSPIGKLERSAMGLVVLTNDGTLSKSLANPRHGIRQIYHVQLNKELSQVVFFFIWSYASTVKFNFITKLYFITH